MAKAGMRRPSPTEAHGTESNKKHNKENKAKQVIEIQGKAKSGHEEANTIQKDI